MTISESNIKLRKLIDHVIEDGIITHSEYESIMEMVHDDMHVDYQERAMLRELQNMIENKTIILKG
jgi:hypothetical protein